MIRFVRNLNRLAAAGGLLGGLIYAQGSADAQIPCRYEVTQVFHGPPCGILGPSPIAAIGISPNGHYVCGYYTPCFGDVHRAFYWTADTGMVTLPLPNGMSTMQARDVNDAGQVVGSCGGSSGDRGFIYNVQSNQFKFVNNLAPGQIEISAINNAGVSCGTRTIDPTPYTAAFIRAADGTLTDLGVISGPRSGATDIAEDGTVVGWTGPGTSAGTVAFIYDQGRITLLPPVAPGGSSLPSAINNNHTVAGRGLFPRSQPFEFVSRAFVYSNGQMIVIDPIAGFEGSAAWGINDAGMVTGDYRINNSRLSYVWHDGGAYIVDNLVHLGSGSYLDDVGAINNGGLIVASGVLNSSEGVGLLLTPQSDVPGDVDQNCRTDIDDLVDVIINWGKTRSPADLNHDAIVDVLDLTIVIQNWSIP